MKTFGSLFTGIGGFDLGLEQAGWTCAWQVEIDEACRRVLERRFDGGGHDAGYEQRELLQPEAGRPLASVSVEGSPAAPLRFSDITTIKGTDLRAVDLICGGFPCQDLSVAGRRKGLAGERSGLFFEFMRIVSEISPRWVLIENVPGLLSSNGGRDMGIVLSSLGELGYGWTYRILDAQYFGVAQRRRRVFIVGCLGDSASAAQVLFEPESCDGDLAPSRKTGARVASSLETRPSDARLRDSGGVHP